MFAEISWSPLQLAVLKPGQADRQAGGGGETQEQHDEVHPAPVGLSKDTGYGNTVRGQVATATTTVFL